jgi:hypothetical protein
MRGLAHFRGGLEVLACTMLLGVLLVGCAALDEAFERTVTVTAADGTTSEVPVGDIVAETAAPAGDIVGSVVGVVTGNPVTAAASAALAAALLAGARRKKKVVALASTETQNT